MFRRIFFVLLLYCPLMAASPVKAGEKLIFIVNKTNPIESLSAREVRDYFFKQKRVWSNGSTVRFIDRENSPERDAFLESILKKTAVEVDQYWIGRKLYSGDSAPVQSSSDEMSIRFVSTFKEAIGYISSSTSLKNKEVKVIKIVSE